MCAKPLLCFMGDHSPFAAAFVAAVTLRFSFGYEDGIAAIAQPQRGLILSHHKTEHHLQADQQRMEVPNDGGFVQQCDPVSRRNTTEGRNTLRHQLLFVSIEGICILIEILAGNEGESQIFQRLGDPLHRLCIFLLKAHIHSIRIVGKGHCQSFGIRIAFHFPNEFRLMIADIQLLEGVEDGFHWYICVTGDPDKPLHCKVEGKRRSTTKIVVTQDFSPALDSSTTGCHQGLIFNNKTATHHGWRFLITEKTRRSRSCAGFPKNHHYKPKVKPVKPLLSVILPFPMTV